MSASNASFTNPSQVLQFDQYYMFDQWTGLDIIEFMTYDHNYDIPPPCKRRKQK